MAQILAHAPAERQTAFFSATFGRSVEALSAQYQRDAVRVTVASDRSEAAAITHLYATVEQPNKLALLRASSQLQAASSALVFVSLKATVPLVTRALCDAGLSADGLHGDMLQPERDLALAKFRNGSTRVLVATDVAARGIDVESLGLVVNYDLPTRFDVYVHRVGRTGRAGKTGIALSLATPREATRIAALGTALEIRFEPLSQESPQLGAAPTAQSTQSHEPAAMQTLRIAAGRKQKLRPADILGALTGEAGGLEGSQIGKIEIHDHFSYVAVAKRVSREAQRGLSTGRIKGRRIPVALLD
jgi:ATP-independent RNA helicase DbpA